MNDHLSMPPPTNNQYHRIFGTPAFSRRSITISYHDEDYETKIIQQLHQHRLTKEP